MSTPEPEGGSLPTMEELPALVVSLCRAVDALTQRQHAGEVRSWLTIDDPDTATDLLADLIGWLHAVWARYPDSDLAPCWYRHPWVIEELNACRAAWLGALRKGAPAGLLAEWHRTVRPGTHQRIRTALRACDLETHPVRPDPFTEPDDPDAVVGPWLAGRDEPALPEPGAVA